MHKELINIGVDKLLNFLKKTYQKPTDESKKKILFDAGNQYTPGGNYVGLICLRVFARMGYESELFCSRSDSPGRVILDQLCLRYHSYANVWNVIPFLPKIILAHFRNFRAYFDMDKIFHISIGKVYIGDAVYDEYIRQSRHVTIAKINIAYFVKLTEAYYFYFLLEQLYKKRHYEYVIVNHHCYIRQMIMSRLALEMGIKPIFFAQDAIKKLTYQNIGDLYHKPRLGLFKLFSDDQKAKLLNQVDSAFSLPKYNIESSGFKALGELEHDAEFKNFMEALDNSDLKKVVIASHCFIDNVVGADGRRSLYRDFYLWLMDTIKRALDNEHILLIFKRHPREDGSGARVGSEEMIRPFLAHPRFLVCPDRVSTEYFMHHIHAVITSRGSIGWELARYGIPTIAAGRGHTMYSGFGFVIEPDCLDDYYDCIDKIHQLEKLKEEHMEQAKLFATLYEKMLSHALPSAECKFTREDHMVNPGVYHWNTEGWDRGVYKLETYDALIRRLKIFEEHCLDRFAKQLEEFLSDSTCYTLGEYLALKKLNLLGEQGGARA